MYTRLFKMCYALSQISNDGFSAFHLCFFFMSLFDPIHLSQHIFKCATYLCYQDFDHTHALRFLNLKIFRKQTTTCITI